MGYQEPGAGVRGVRSQELKSGGVRSQELKSGVFRSQGLESGISWQ